MIFRSVPIATAATWPKQTWKTALATTIPPAGVACGRRVLFSARENDG
ncbi:MAG: hypothetical protein IH585_16795 [Anaerolineaceae bacterium]|nr:hypothetical protein [Anaerolineaceae bacterium]